MSTIDVHNVLIKGSDYCCVISLISKTEAINLMENADLTEKNGTLQSQEEFRGCKFERKIINQKIKKICI